MLVGVLLLLLFLHLEQLWFGLEFISSINGREEEVDKLTKQEEITEGGWGLAVQSGLLAILGTLLTNLSHLILNAFFSSTKPAYL